MTIEWGWLGGYILLGASINPAWATYEETTTYGNPSCGDEEFDPWEEWLEEERQREEGERLQEELDSQLNEISAPSQPTQTKEEAKQECLGCARTTLKLCEESARETYLQQYGACEAVGWLGYSLNLNTLDIAGNVPDTCGPKLETVRDLELARCSTDSSINEQLCN